MIGFFEIWRHVNLPAQNIGQGIRAAIAAR